jgi:hypothetical protein
MRRIVIALGSIIGNDTMTLQLVENSPMVLECFRRLSTRFGAADVEYIIVKSTDNERW